jgi:dTDP-4-dehydrorhamnose 3,5-epimerase
MKITKSRLEGVLVIEPDIFGDDRGFFMESYNAKNFADAGITSKFVQDNHSRSSRGVLRGLHYQIPPKAQDKLVRVTLGEVFDVAVDLRVDSPTFAQWDGFIISEENKKQVFIPKGFAHGFLVLSDTAEFLYKCGEYYSPEHERGIIWNDPNVGIKWPGLEENDSPTLSAKDAALPTLENAEQIF